MSKHIIKSNKLERDNMSEKIRRIGAIRGFMMPSSYPQDHRAPLRGDFKAALALDAKKFEKFLALKEQGLDEAEAHEAAFPVPQQAD
jgi:hypothetical protein